MPVERVPLGSGGVGGGTAGNSNTNTSTVPNNGVIGNNPINNVNYPTKPVNQKGFPTNLQPQRESAKNGIDDTKPIEKLKDGTLTQEESRDLFDTSIEFNLSVVSDVYVDTPDIVEISYPKEVRGADFVGYKVDFDISWNSVYANYIRVYIGNSEKYTEQPKRGKLKLNVEEILTHYVDFEDSALLPTESDDKFKFKIRLVPFNTSGTEVVSGKEEVLDIVFDKGDLTIPREVAINRIAEGFISQFDRDVFSESKYLTHLLHLGDGDNKVITNWLGLNSTENGDELILKLYEPLPVSVQTNQLVWLSKIQAEPIIETVTLIGEDLDYCPPLQGPNFSLEPDNGIGYQIYDDLLASGSQTSDALVRQYISKTGIDTEVLNIEYTSGSEFVFENFVHFGSAEERIKNFWYKLELLETYEASYEELVGTEIVYGDITTEDGKILLTELSVPIQFQSPSLNTSAVLEANNVITKINNVFGSFDGFETFLYTSTDNLAYPKSGNSVVATTSQSAIDWYNEKTTLANLYDRDNTNYLNNNLPEFIKEDYQNAEFMLFMDMVGQHFDTIWAYINSLTKLKNLNQQSDIGFSNELVYHMLESLGWEGKKAYDSQYLWEYALGQYKDGTQKYQQSLKSANEEVWRRILNNLPYLLKHKGTSRSLKAVMACYGIPTSLLTIMEFGGPTDPTNGGTQPFTFDDRTAALNLDGTSYVKLDWKYVNVATSPESPNSLEFRYKSDYSHNGSIVKMRDGAESYNYWDLRVVPTTSTKARLDFEISGSMATIYSASTPEFNFFNGEYTQIVINRTETSPGESFDIVVKQSIGDRLAYDSTTTLAISESTQWNDIGGNRFLQIGRGFSGSIDEFRIWKTALEDGVINNHTLFPDAINGNTYTSSTEDLVFRNDFEYPKDRWLDDNIINVAINTEYILTASLAVDFASGSTTYPYHYEPYERRVTAKVPSLGFTYSDKLRFETQTLVGDLSHKSRATKKSFDQAPVDSNRLGLFFSPNKELNMDILKAFGEFNIDNYIGAPADEYRDEYSELKDLRTYYFQRLDRNVSEYINLVRQIDKSLFDVLTDLVPARAKVSKGLLIEPHYLERSKTKWDKPTSEKRDYETSINIDDDVTIDSSNHTYQTTITADNDIQLLSDVNTYEGTLDAEEEINLVSTVPTYDARIGVDDDTELIGETPFYDANVVVESGATLTSELDQTKLEQIGFDDDGFGLWGYNGVSIVKELDIFGNFTSSRQDVYLVKQSYSASVQVQTEGWPATTNNEQVKYEIQNEQRFKYVITKLPMKASTLTSGGDIVEVTPLDGYFPSHYRYKNNLSEGLQKSFFKGSKQTSATTPDGLDPIETFTTNPNILRVADTGRGSGEPILEVD